MFSGRLTDSPKREDALFSISLVVILCSYFGICPGDELPDWIPTPPTTATTTTTLRQKSEPSTASSPVEYGAGVEQWVPLVAGHFEPEDRERILCLMGFESEGNPTAKNPSGARGLMQIMPFWASEYGLEVDELFVPEINLWVARKVLDSQGWTAWSPYKRGECR